MSEFDKAIHAPEATRSTPASLRLVLGVGHGVEPVALKAFLARMNERRDSAEAGARQRVSIRTNDSRIVAVLSGEGFLHHDIAAARAADAAILAFAGEHGLTPSVRRQLYLFARMGIQHIALAVHGVAKVDRRDDRMIALESQLEELAFRIGLIQAVILPIPTHPSGAGHASGHGASLRDHQGTLASFLDIAAESQAARSRLPFRFNVDTVQSIATGKTVVLGTIASGTIGAGDRVRIQPMGKESRIDQIALTALDDNTAPPDHPATLTLGDAIDLPVGSVISTTDAPATVADQFEAELVWLNDEPLFPGRRYQARVGSQSADLTVTDIKYEVNVDTLERLAANQLSRDGIAVCNLSLNQAVAFDTCNDNPATGFLTILDRETGEPLGIGLLHFALRRAENIHIQHVDINRAARATQKNQNPCVVWFTGLSGSGKSTIANLVEQRLYQLGHHTYLLDGDNVRHGLNRDLGFTEADRVENIRRVGEVAKLMVDAGLIVLTAFISPFRTERQMARDLLSADEFLEVFVDVPLSVAEERDPKGLYKKARRGELKNFTGIDSPYEAPQHPELVIDTGTLTASEAADRVLDALRARGRLQC